MMIRCCIGAGLLAATAAGALAPVTALLAKGTGMAYVSSEKDNAIGRFMFGMTTYVQRSARTRRALLNMTAAEQAREGRQRRMSTVLWDMFTGSSSYREIMMRAMHPAFISRLGWNLIARRRA